MQKGLSHLVNLQVSDALGRVGAFRLFLHNAHRQSSYAGGKDKGPAYCHTRYICGNHAKGCLLQRPYQLGQVASLISDLSRVCLKLCWCHPQTVTVSDCPSASSS